jgi:hypothetical protein
MNKNILLIAITIITLSACKKEGCLDENASNYNHDAKKDNGSCEYNAPSTYTFTDANGNSTVSYGGQTERLDQLGEMATYAKAGTANNVSSAVLNDMFQNTGGNGGGNFSFTSTKDLKSKCFVLDTSTFMAYFDSIEIAAQNNLNTASNGQAGVLTSGTSTYLFSANGIEYAQVIEKGLMGAVLYYQMNSVYLSDSKMNVDNTTPADPGAGKYYTGMEHHFDEAFGYFGADIDFPTNTTNMRFWAKYSNSQDAQYGLNSTLMNAFLNGRYAITQNDYTTRDAQITVIRENMEILTAAQAVSYIDDAIGYFGTDQAKFLHVVSEAYAFINAIRYTPVETRNMTPTEVDLLLANFGTNFWNITALDLNTIKSALVSTYNL